MKIFQKGFNYSQDGPGNRLVLHLQGCNMKCPWCANPEGMDVNGVYMDEGELKGKRWSYTESTIEELVEEIESCRLMFYDGGGITFSGGEATLQFDELKEVLLQVKKRGIHTAIETNGSHPRFLELHDLVDYFIIDCKQYDEEKHRKHTGISNKIIKKNIIDTCKNKSRVHVRIPLIGGVNDSSQDLLEFVDFAKVIQGENVTFEVITYHEYGKVKWGKCGYEYQMDETAHVGVEKANKLKESLIECGVKYIGT